MEPETTQASGGRQRNTSSKKYRVIHGSIGLDAKTMKYKYTKGDIITDMDPEEAARHIASGLLAEER